MEVVCTFVGELPESQTFVRMDNRVAIEELRTKFGITITDDYEQTALLYG